MGRHAASAAWRWPLSPTCNRSQPACGRPRPPAAARYTNVTRHAAWVQQAMRILDGQLAPTPAHVVHRLPPCASVATNRCAAATSCAARQQAGSRPTPSLSLQLQQRQLTAAQQSRRRHSGPNLSGTTLCRYCVYCSPSTGERLTCAVPSTEDGEVQACYASHKVGAGGGGVWGWCASALGLGGNRLRWPGAGGGALGIQHPQPPRPPTAARTRHAGRHAPDRELRRAQTV